MDEKRKGKRLIISLFAILAIIICFVVHSLAFVQLNPSSLSISDVEIKDDCIKFSLLNANSALLINKTFHYQVEDNQLFISFYGTLFSCLSMESDEINIAIKNAENIESIVIVDKEYSRTVWSKE